MPEDRFSLTRVFPYKDRFALRKICLKTSFLWPVFPHVRTESDIMPEYGFSLTRIFPYKGRIFDSAVTQENTGQRKTMFWHILRSDFFWVNFPMLLQNRTRLRFRGLKSPLARNVQINKCCNKKIKECKYTRIILFWINTIWFHLFYFLFYIYIYIYIYVCII